MHDSYMRVYVCVCISLKNTSTFFYGCFALPEAFHACVQTSIYQRITQDAVMCVYTLGACYHNR